jgi:hypothetical protein
MQKRRQKIVGACLGGSNPLLKRLPSDLDGAFDFIEVCSLGGFRSGPTGRRRRWVPVPRVPPSLRSGSTRGYSRLLPSGRE